MRTIQTAILSVDAVLFRSEAAQAARWLCVSEGVVRLLQTRPAAFPEGQDAARLLKYRERLPFF